MPFRKGKQYKRFNVGEYMRQQKVAASAIEKRKKEVKAKAGKLKRLDKKVRIYFFIQLGFLMPNKICIEI